MNSSLFTEKFIRNFFHLCFLFSFAALIKEENNIEEEESLEEEFAAYLNESKNESINDQDLLFNKNKTDDEGTFVDISEDLLKNED